MRAANYPLKINSDVEVTLSNSDVTVKGKQGLLSLKIHPDVSVVKTDEGLNFSVNTPTANAQLGTCRALITNMLTGVHEGFEKKLELIGVGYRADVKGKTLELLLGYSHPVNFPIPEGIKVTVEKQTRISVWGIDKQEVGQVAANIRSKRPVEPYKGKGVRYTDELVIRKEAKKK